MRPAQESRAVDDVGDTAFDRSQQLEVIGRVIFEVGVLYDYHSAPGFLETSQCSQGISWHPTVIVALDRSPGTGAPAPTGAGVIGVAVTLGGSSRDHL